MKKNVTILLIALFLLNGVVYFFSIPLFIDFLKNRFKENEDRYEANAMFETSEGIANNIVFVGEKEISVDGKMFDILRIEKSGNKTVYYCYHDKEEENLEKGFLQGAKEKTDNQRHIQQVRPVGVFLLSNFKYDLKNLQSLTFYPASIMQNIKITFREVITPPPNSLYIQS